MKNKPIHIKNDTSVQTINFEFCKPGEQAKGGMIDFRYVDDKPRVEFNWTDKEVAIVTSRPTTTVIYIRSTQQNAIHASGAMILAGFVRTDFDKGDDESVTRFEAPYVLNEEQRTMLTVSLQPEVDSGWLSGFQLL